MSSSKTKDYKALTEILGKKEAQTIISIFTTIRSTVGNICASFILKDLHAEKSLI